MKKNLALPLSLSLCFLLFGCNTATTSIPATETIPIPTQTIAPIESAIDPEPSPNPTEELPSIAYDEIKEGRLASPSDVETWAFEAQAGERVNLVLNSQFDSYLELYAPDGELIASSDDTDSSLDAALFDVQVRRSGRHSVAVRGYNGATGSYALALTGGHPTTGGGLLTPAETHTVVLTPQGVKWNYEGQKDTYLTVNLETDEAIVLSLFLYGPNGTLLANGDNNGATSNAEIFEFQLPEDGLYTIRTGTAAKIGLARLTLNSSDAPSGGGLLTMGQSQSGTLQPGRTHRWNFAGEAGQIINLSLTSSDFDTFLELRDPQERILAENDDSGGTTNSAIDLVRLPADDTYSVIARGLAETDGGEYELTLKPTKVAPGGGDLLPDTPNRVLLLPSQTDTWRFEADANSFITIEAESVTIDTYLELYGPDDQLLAEDDDSGGDLNATILNYPIKESGLYQVVVRLAQEGGDASGVYEIRLTVNENLETTGALTSGDSQKARLEVDEQHSWTFEAEEDYFVTVKMESPTLDTYLSLYNSEGTLLAVNDDFLGRQAVIANFIVPKAGQYRVVARAYSAEAAGDYTIFLDVTKDPLPISETP